jgi:CRISPR-associated protein Cas5h
MEKIISIDFKADFGFLRKPDTNDGISMSYNMLHKPGLLGIFGAILGLEGYQKRGELPEYYQKLSNLKVGIAPLCHDNGNFPKTTIVYTNTVGYANKDGNFIAYENTLVRPSYRVYLSIDQSHALYAYLKNGQAEYIPYLGKNEFPIWWERDSFREYEPQPFDYGTDYEVKTLFVKNEDEQVRGHDSNSKTLNFASLLSQSSKSFFYFERLPIGFQQFETKRGKEYQYAMAPFVYSNARFYGDYKLKNLYMVGDSEVIQLN